MTSSPADPPTLTWELAPGDGADTPPTAGWLPASVPGGVAEGLRAAAAPAPDLDACDWWFRTFLDVHPPAVGERLRLHLDGVTPPATVLLDGVPVAEVASMFLPTTVPVSGPTQLHVRCHALGPLLSTPRRPRARWRTKVADGGLRFVRTSLLGRAPGFAPGPPVVGPWRPVRLERVGGVVVDERWMRTSLVDDEGRLSASLALTPLVGTIASARLLLHGPSGEHSVELAATDAGRWSGDLTVPGVARWWPHTHGEPALHTVTIEVRCADQVHDIDAGRVGFRTLAAGASETHEVDSDGLDLHVNGVRVFARGAVWTRPGGLTSTVPLRPLLEQVRDAGANMLRLPGTGAYEDAEFHDLCDELGILVWQDAMLANFDYPAADPTWMAVFETEMRAALAALARRPSFVVFCGGSEIEQQAAMTGVPADQVRGPLTAEVLPRLLADSGADAVWVPGSPCGGVLPFHTSTGVTHYFGVGGYRRPIEDVRRAHVRFASECLAIANLPAQGAVSDADLLAGLGVPRDVGADWDFADVREHYLQLLYGVAPQALRAADPEGYLRLSREVSGALMAEVFGEWRRACSPCGGGLVLWLCDQVPGAGWGLFDHAGRAKPALEALTRIWAPVAVWTTDEGLNGVDIHVANDRPEVLRARIGVWLLLGGQRVDGAERDLEIAPHGSWQGGVEHLLGRFADASHAYAFGPPGHNAIVVRLTGPVGLLSESIRHLGGRRALVESGPS